MNPADALDPAAMDDATAIPRPCAPARSEPVADGRGWWLGDFRLRRGALHVATSGADIQLGGALAGEALVWLKFYVAVSLRYWRLVLAGRRGPRIWFTPQRPRPWYLVRSALSWAGGCVARSPQEADAVFTFEDATWTFRRPGPGKALNAACTDTSKGRVAEVFETVFGYPLAVDPAEWRSEAVEKSETNGTHDGRIVQCPRRRREGMHYQRLIDTGDDRFTHDLRTPCVGGRPVLVCVKRKRRETRFSIHNAGVDLRMPEAVFSRGELDTIGRFLQAMGIDWGGLDILRDRVTGRIYVVDVNKTDVGPIIALSWRDKLRSTALLAEALQRLVAGVRQTDPRPTAND